MNRIAFRPALDSGLFLCLLLTLVLALPLALNPRLPAGGDVLLLLYFALCSGGMYAFCKRRSGRLGALIAGLAYVYSPYLMHDAPYARAAYAELLALALFPLLLWRLDALRDRPEPLSFLLTCLLQAALISTGLVTALVLTGIVVVWLGVETLIQLFNREASQMRARSGALAALALLLGLLASATIWLPMAQADKSAAPEWRVGFLTLEDLLSPPPIQDAGALNGLRELSSLGLAQWALAGLGALSALALYVSGYRTRHPNAFLGAACFSALAILLIALMQPAAADLWSDSPLQLRAARRLLGPAAACLAILASMNGLWLRRLKARYQSSTIAVVVAVPIVTVIPLLYVPAPRSSLETAPQLRESAGQISGLAAGVALLLAIVAVWRLRNWQLTPRPYWTAPALSRRSVVGILMGGTITLFSLLITYREGIAWINSPPGQALPAQVQRVYTISDKVELLGYDLNAEAFIPGDRLVFRAYWYAPARPAVDYSSFLVLSAGEARQVLALKPHPGGRPTSELWGPDGYMVDSYEVNLPADLPTGEYELIIGLAACASARLDDCAATDAAGASLGGSAAIATIRVAAS